MRLPLFMITSPWRGLIGFCGLAVVAAAQAINVEWFEAARMGDTAMLKQQLAAGVNIDQTDFSKHTALNHALAGMQFEAARLLIERGASLSHVAEYRTPLIWAMQAGDLGIVRLMLEKGADPRVSQVVPMGGEINLLSSTVQWGRVDMLRLFESKGYGVSAEYYKDMIYWAARHGETAVVSHFLGKGGDPNLLYRDNLALDVAAFHGDLPTVEALLKGGARPNLISEGESQAKDWAPLKRTPLISAVIADEREMTERLLKAGADAKAMNGAAAVWADLVGDEELLRMLKNAGAKEPGPFAFADWLGQGYEAGRVGPERQRASAGEATVAELGRLGALRNERSSSSAQALPDGTKIAIVIAGEGLADAEALMSVRAGALPGAVVLERTEIRRIVAERRLAEMFARPGGEAEAGRLLGADVVVFLKSHLFEKTKVREARVVATRTGVVAGTSYAPESRGLEEWAAEAMGDCVAAGDVLRAEAGAFRLVAVPRVVASLNTAETRELERRLTLVLAAQIGRLPNVFIAEREALDRLVLEQDAKGAAFAASAWIMDATLDVPLGEGGEIKLSLSLRNGAKGNRVQLESVAPRAGDTAKLTNDMMAKIAAALGAPGQPMWAQESEAAEFLARAKRYAGIYMWAEAGASIESAWALGLRTDEVARRRLQSAVTRLTNMQRVILPQKRKRKNYSGLAEFVSLRAPLLMPVEDARELSLDEQLELANLALDVYAASLPGLKGSFGGEQATPWLCGEVWDAATVPLRLTEPLSYRRTHGAELDALRGRLLALHAQALGIARSRRSATEVHALTGIGMKNLAWWQPQEEVFRKTVRQTLRDASAWTAPLSEQAAWTAAWKIAEPLMGELTGRAGQAWVRLARELSVSSDAREAYLGLGLLALETNSLRRRVEIMQALKERFPAISDLDRGINTRVINVTWADTYNDLSGVYIWQPWYQAILQDLRHKISPKILTIQVGLPRDTAQKMTGERDRVYPEIRAFHVMQGARRLETIKRAGPGGMLWFYSSRKHGYTSDEMDQIRGLKKEITPLFAELVKRFPEVAVAHEQLESSIRGVGIADVGYGTGLSIDSGKLINPFLDRYKDMPTDLKARWRLAFQFDDVGAGSRGWYFARVMTGYAQGFHEDVKLDETVMFRIGPDGNPTELRKAIGPFYMRYHLQSGKQPQVSDRWLVIPGHGGKRDASYDPTRERIAVADMRDPTAEPRFFPLASSDGGLRWLRLVGDRVIYSFVHNPTGSAGGGPYDFEKKGDATFGVAEIDLITGRETLLASSRRQPPVAPIEGEKFRVFSSIWLIGESAFTVSDGGKRSNYAFDLVSREWRTLTEADGKAAAKDRSAYPSYPYTRRIMVDGAWLRLDTSTRDNNLRFLGEKGIGKIDIAVNFDYSVLESAHMEWTKAHEEAVRVKGWGHKEIVITEHGLIVTLRNGFYYWLPMEKVRAVLSRALAARRTTTPASPAVSAPGQSEPQGTGKGADAESGEGEAGAGAGAP